jgi:hypothetical protein
MDEESGLTGYPSRGDAFYIVADGLTYMHLFVRPSLVGFSFWLLNPSEQANERSSFPGRLRYWAELVSD